MVTINAKPTAKVAIKRNVLKQYNIKGQESVFMADGTEFELELFNPLRETIMCKISLNEKKEDYGIVLYPGQRVFLERYLKSDSKFKFITYKVEENSTDVDNAIAMNGDIKAEFFKEFVYSNSWTYNYPNYDGNLTYTATGGCIGDILRSSVSCFYSNSSDTAKSVDRSTTQKETGIIGKGEKSNQGFNNVYNDFQHFPFETVNIKILPDSQQLVDADDLKYKKYCSNCGKKVKHGDKFCSYCGSKL